MATSPRSFGVALAAIVLLAPVAWAGPTATGVHHGVTFTLVATYR
ncbi:MAG: hypothetical protein ACYC2H_13425 [Thermoplasmatota archaeon]